MICEKCSATVANNNFDMFDYCANCSKNLCAKCMVKGCCGKTPAESGMNEDHGDEE